MRVDAPMIANVHDILFLDEEPDKAVQYLADIDVIRMPIYIQQILETVWADILKDGSQRMTLRAPECPWLKWVRESQANYSELWNYGMDIMDEHFHRFGARNMHPYRHGSDIGFKRLGTVPNSLPDKDKTSMPLPIEDAREYYRGRIDAIYTNRSLPEWRNQSN